MPKIINRREKQLNVIEAAIPIFAKNGFYNTKMSEIAVEADIGKGSLYEYFNNKEDLFFKTFELWFSLFNEEIASIKSKRYAPEKKITEIFNIFFQNIEQFQNSYYIYFDFWAELIRNKDYKEKLASIYSELRNNLVEVIDELQTENSLPSEHWAAMMVGVAEGLMIQWMVDDQSFEIGRVGMTAVEAIVKQVSA
jgi:AcrR family transcriptional regulator